MRSQAEIQQLLDTYKLRLDQQVALMRQLQGQRGVVDRDISIAANEITAAQGAIEALNKVLSEASNG